MDQFLQNFNANSALTIAAICGGLCLVAVILFFGLQLISGTFGVVIGIVELFVHVFSGGPIAWCGCLLLLASCAVCSGIVIALLTILPKCGTPEAVNFCQLFGR